MEDKFPQKTEKPWGFELLFALTPKYAGKVIFVRKGHRLSLQYHEKKDEVRNIGLGPEHDWASHGADAFGLMCIVYEEPRIKKSESIEYESEFG